VSAVRVECEASSPAVLAMLACHSQHRTVRYNLPRAKILCYDSRVTELILANNGRWRCRECGEADDKMAT
jgi:hypothetical protein